LSLAARSPTPSPKAAPCAATRLTLQRQNAAATGHVARGSAVNVTFRQALEVALPLRGADDDVDCVVLLNMEVDSLRSALVPEV